VKAISQPVQGTILVEANHSALLLRSVAPASPSAESLYLRYAYILQGTEAPILPAFVLDDWGSEVKGLDLYQWVHQFGDQFPRAEMFGFELNGGETQCFLRELELQAQLLCYAYPTKETPLAAGVAVEAILLLDDLVTVPQRIQRPRSFSRPLRSAKVSWWLVKPPVTSLTFLLN
jgi:hypothetical protein